MAYYILFKPFSHLKPILLLWALSLFVSPHCYATERNSRIDNHIKDGYIFGNTHHTIIPKTQDFIQALSAEIFHKTGIRVYFDIIDSINLTSPYGTKQTRKQHQESTTQTLQSPYVLISLFVQDKKFNLISSPDLHDFLDNKALDSIYFDYMAPLIPEKEQDLTPQRFSAIILNGYAELADTISKYYHITLENNIQADDQGVRSFVRVIMYGMILSLLGLYAFVHFTSRNKKDIQ